MSTFFHPLCLFSLLFLFLFFSPLDMVLLLAFSLLFVTFICSLPPPPPASPLSGFITTNHSHNHSLFYWFTPSDSALSDPVVLWMNGGPGASSILYGFLDEMGPYRVNSTIRGPGGLSPWPFSWTQRAHMLWVDQPYGVGYSVTDVEEDYAEVNTGLWMDEMVIFLEQFFLRYPQYNQGQPFFIFGESYAGHYVPSLGVRIVRLCFVSPLPANCFFFLAFQFFLHSLESTATAPTQ